MNKPKKQGWPHCPKCGQPAIMLQEVWRAYPVITWVAGSLYEDGIKQEDEGEPDHVVAVCKCRHSWRLRGRSQIEESWFDKG